MEFGPAGRQVGTLASSRSAGPFDSAGLHVAGIEDGTARGPPVFGVWGGAWGAVGRGVTWLRGPRVGTFSERRGRRSHDPIVYHQVV